MITELKNIVNSEVDTPDGKATLQEIYVTELGYVMAKLYYKRKKCFINHKIGELQTMMKTERLNLSEWTSKIKLQEKLAA